MEPQATPSIASRMAIGIGWLVLTRIAVRSLGLVSMAVLARLLVPEDFGLIALAAIVVGALEIFSDFKLDLALIHYPKNDRRLYDTVWTFGVVRGFAIGLVLLLAASPVAAFYNDPRLTSILWVLALTSAIDGFQNVGLIEYNKELRFDRNFQFQVVTKLIGLVVTIAAALIWQSYWALIYGIVARSIVAVAMSYSIHPFRPRLCLFESMKLLSFSKWIMFSSLMHFASNKIDSIMLGKLENMQTLGFYNLARDISALPTTELVGPMQSASWSGYAKLGHDKERLIKEYLSNIASIVGVVLPVAMGVGFTADYFVPLIYTDKWAATIPLIQILTVAGVLRLLLSNSGSVYAAIGAPHYITYLTAATMLVQAPALFVGINSAGAIGAACALVISAVVGVIIAFGVLSSRLNIGFRLFARNLWRSIVAAGVMAVALIGMRILWPVGAGNSILAAQLAAAILVGVMTYVPTHFALWHLSGRPEGIERIALRVLRAFIDKINSKRGTPIAVEPNVK